MTSTTFAVAQARRCNRLVIAHKVAGNLVCMGQCKGMRALWMCEARAVKLQADIDSQAAEIKEVARDLLNCSYADHLRRSSYQNACLSAIVDNARYSAERVIEVWKESGLTY